MNDKNLKIIIQNYISKYGEILQERNASHLWRTAAKFKTLADDLLNADEEEFTDKLFKLCERSKVSIDGKFIQPMNSINDFAAKEPETVRHLLKSLLAPDWDNMNLRQNKIETFVKGCNELQNRYYPNNIRYYMTKGKAIAILSMYDSDCNYMYQESPARLFAQCIGFEGNWGSGNNFDYATYYRMCEELTEYIRSDQQLIFTSCGRYQHEEGLHADQNYHLLAYDIILCNAKYKLYEGIQFSSKILAESKIHHRCQQEAVICFQKYRNAWENNIKLTKGHISFWAMIKPGIRVSHIKMGKGTVETIEGDNAIISFGEEKKKKFNMLQSVLNDFIRIEEGGFDEWKVEFEAVLSRKAEIQNQLEAISRQLEGCISLLMGV